MRAFIRAAGTLPLPVQGLVFRLALLNAPQRTALRRGCSARKERIEQHPIRVKRIENSKMRSLLKVANATMVVECTLTSDLSKSKRISFLGRNSKDFHGYQSHSINFRTKCKQFLHLLPHSTKKKLGNLQDICVLPMQRWYGVIIGSWNNWGGTLKRV